MPTALDFHRASVITFKNTLDSKSSAEKQRRVSILLAKQFNEIVEDIKREYPDSARHLPPPITWTGLGADDMQVADIRFLDFEMMINRVLAVLEVLGASTPA